MWGWPELTLAEMQAEEPGLTAAVFDVLTVDASVGEPHEPGRHGAFANVAAQARRWQQALRQEVGV